MRAAALAALALVTACRPGAQVAGLGEHVRLEGVEPTVRAAWERLATATCFRAWGIDHWRWGASDEAIDVHALVRHPRARELLCGLVERASPAGRLYGLCGLWAVDRRLYSCALVRWAGLRDPVEVARGCLGTTEPFGSVLETDVRSGESPSSYEWTYPYIDDWLAGRGATAR